MIIINNKNNTATTTLSSSSSSSSTKTKTKTKTKTTTTTTTKTTTTTTEAQQYAFCRLYFQNKHIEIEITRKTRNLQVQNIPKWTRESNAVHRSSPLTVKHFWCHHRVGLKLVPYDIEKSWTQCIAKSVHNLVPLDPKQEIEIEKKNQI